MYKVLESVTLDTQHVISFMHLKTHELSLVLQKAGLGPSILSYISVSYTHLTLPTNREV